ncbi:glycosyl hydrolase 115 family protein [Pedobacter sp. SYSU D00535]|uniref:glycosyl hydrolase 115 family protein n=1 Tax=Pedobacter sp. SYSU D00535 TaxID=2810308 RepID=UPI001A971509|nr:glycosyl hydrolase 115 family protein [Pedobacter sp. SYSU D00535]
MRLRVNLLLTIGCAFVLGIAAVQPVLAQSIQVSEVRSANAFPLVENSKGTAITYDPADATVVRIAAEALAADIQQVTGVKPLVGTQTPGGLTILVGTLGRSKVVDDLAAKGKIEAAKILAAETFLIQKVDFPEPGNSSALVIAGRDPRGTAFGVFELSKLIGVHPFSWWADIHPNPRKSLYISGSHVAKAPSVKYRGIFLNDEDWGLQPWAAKTFEPETGDIGPKTYGKIFELLLRLKANLIWPAMHPSTKAFFHYPGNQKVAEDYAIIIGTSHAEPMLRNNVDEWDKQKMGAFNYLTNKSTITKYWEDRIKQSANVNAMYTLGMRGVHDSGMEGVKSAKEALPLLEQIIGEQRSMLSKNLKKPVTEIPQAFTAYKEVLEIYDLGLKLPEDVTLVWPDDNYGYIHRLNNKAEMQRSGGSGVYYHASYWGRPHDYLWLSSTHPALIREEMMKAYVNKSDKLWVLNVGDIKPLEYNIHMFMDMAWNAEPFMDPAYAKTHLADWNKEVFGARFATRITDIMWKYYDLAFERRPEFMGWSQTEPTTQTSYSEYNHFYFGDEGQRRIDAYTKLEKEVKQLQIAVAPEDADAFYQLVYYPVVGASLMNRKFLYRDKSNLYARQNRLSAEDYARMSKEAYESIKKETYFYNNQLADGKWKHMMSMEPRALPVYKEPVLPEITIDRSQLWGLLPEGLELAPTSGKMSLPMFNRYTQKKYFVDIFLSDDKPLKWKAQPSQKWIKLSESEGTLNGANKENRIWVSVDWEKAPARQQLSGHVMFSAAGKKMHLEVKALAPSAPDLATFNGHLEDNGRVSIAAASFSRKKGVENKEWKLVDGLGHMGTALMASPLEEISVPETGDYEQVKASLPVVEYDFYTFTDTVAELKVFSLPTHPLNDRYQMSYLVSVDDRPATLLNFKTLGRSQEWKQNVLRNAAIRTIKLGQLAKGKHTLKIYMVDPGVILDRMEINLGNPYQPYSAVAETKHRK